RAAVGPRDPRPSAVSPAAPRRAARCAVQHRRLGPGPARRAGRGDGRTSRTPGACGPARPHSQAQDAGGRFTGRRVSMPPRMGDTLPAVRGLGDSLKHELVARVLPTESVLDAGGMWGVHGAYALRAATGGAKRVVIMDSLRTPEFEDWSREVANVSFVQGDLNDPGVFTSFPNV